MRALVLFIISHTLFLLPHTYAQDINWQEVQTKIQKKENLTDLNNLLQQAKTSAFSNSAFTVAARCYYYQTQIADLKTEDTLYFKNSFYIDSMLNDQHTPALLQAVLYILKAKRINRFQQEFFYRTNKNLFTIPTGTTNYTRLTLAGLDSLVQGCLQKARQISIELKQDDVRELLWLSSDPLLFLFKPDFADIIFAEQLHASNRASGNFYNFSSQWLIVPVSSFLSAKKLPAGLNPGLEPVFHLYAEWGKYHQADTAISLFIESLARKYFYDKTTNDSTSQQLFQHYLEQLAHSSWPSVHAHGVYQLCLEWYNMGNRYSNPYPENDFYRNNHNYLGFDSSFRNYYTRALSMLQNNSSFLDSFSYLKSNLLLMKQEIESKTLNITNQDVYLPGEPITYYINFKNLRAVYMNIVQLNSLDSQTHPQLSLENISKLTPFKKISIPLPAVNDFQTHAAAIKQDPLPCGYYAVIYSDSVISNENKNLNFFSIWVSNIAAVNNGSRVFLLHRKTGMPLANASLLLQYREKYNGSTISTRVKTTNSTGYLSIHEKNIVNSFVLLKGDTMRISINENEPQIPSEVFDREEEDLVDYYEENTKLCLFTDRAIYRPGQKVCFKGILLTRNPSTGEQVVFSKRNLKFSIWQKLFDADAKAFRKQGFYIYLQNPFDRNIDSIKVTPNEFGSVSGTFNIRADAATGDWQFNVEDVDIDNSNKGSFSVEEYKRPNFEVMIEKPTDYLKLGDSFWVKAKVKSFAGATLNNVRIGYVIKASFNKILKDSLTGEAKDVWQELSIADSSDYTNNEGELSIKITGAFLSLNGYPNEKYYQVNYHLAVNAIDGTGESHEASLSLVLDNRPVKIDFVVPLVYERNEPDSLFITTKNPFSGLVSRQVHVNLFKIMKMNNLSKKQPAATDYQLRQGLWQYCLSNETREAPKEDIRVSVFKKTLTANSEKFMLPKEILESGYYELEVTCRENGKITGEKTKSFSVFDKEKNSFPDTSQDFHHLPLNIAGAGEKVKWYFGNTQANTYSIYEAQYFEKNKKKIKLKYSYDYRTEKAGVKEWVFTMPGNAVGEVVLTHLYIFDNVLHRQSATIYAAVASGNQPEIIIEQYRKKLNPGTKETFALTIKTRNENTAAELMTTMYDASLDKIELHRWDIPNDQLRYRVNPEWQHTITINNNNLLFAPVTNEYYKRPELLLVKPLWWLNPSEYVSLRAGSDIPMSRTDGGPLQGRLAGVSISNNSLNEVVVIGYGIRRSMSMTGSVVSIRGVSSLQGLNIPLVILDGVEYRGNISDINIKLVTDAAVLKGADATAIYGSRAADGVILLSTRGPLLLPKPEESPVVIRKNFSETAFFLPQVHADADGFYNISFEIPESVTEWNWKMLAHTPDAKFAYAERKIVTQLPMMVQPNMPRFLYQGDTILLQTRITNLDTVLLSGKANCVIEDIVTGESVTAAIVPNTTQAFSVGKKSNSNISFRLNIPSNFLHPLKIKISARAGNFSDGEEYIIPILGKKILVTGNLPFLINGSSDTVIVSPHVPADAVPYGIGLYIQPKPQAAMLNAMPSLAFYPYGCAEQTFNKLLAYSLALKIKRSDTAQNGLISPGSNKLQQSNTESLPDELSEQTMPWLQLNHQAAVNQQRLIKIFDTLQTRPLMEKYLGELLAMQNTDGGISWFPGGKSDDYISLYLLENFGKLKKDSISFSLNQPNKLPAFLSSLVSFTDTRFLDFNHHSDFELNYLVARTCWLKQFPMPVNVKLKTDSVLSIRWSSVNDAQLGTQAKLIIAGLQYGDSDASYRGKAFHQIESIRQLAIVDKVNGLRWKEMSNTDDLDESDEETITQLARAFELSGDSNNSIAGIIQWLLKAKEQHSWGTTKATAAAVGLLYRHQSKILGTPITLKTTVGDSILSVTDNLLNGQLFNFSAIQHFPTTVNIRHSETQLVSGGINYYYFTATPPQNDGMLAVKISKRQFKWNNSSNKWELLDSNTILKIADKIKTIITIEAPRQLKYVFIEERQAASLEPADAKSGYEYGQSFSYYRSVKDAGCQFFAEQIPSGISDIEYETVVAKEGSFTTGPVSLECMYQPQVRAYGGGSVIKVN